MGQEILVVGLGLLALFFLFVMFVTIAALILRSACATCNVEQPTFWRAIGIVITNRIAIGGVNGAITYFVTMAAGGNLQGRGGLQLILFLVAIPVAGIVSAAMYSVMLTNCSLWKGFLVWLVEFGIYATLVAVIGGLVLLIVLAIP